MLSHCVSWWARCTVTKPPRFSTEESHVSGKLCSWQTGTVGHPIRPLRGDTAWNSEAGKRSPWQPSEEGQHVHLSTGFASWLPLGPAGQQQPGNPEKYMISFGLQQGGGGWSIDRHRRDKWSIFHVNATAEDDLNSSKFTVGENEPKW